MATKTKTLNFRQCTKDQVREAVDAWEAVKTMSEEEVSNRLGELQDLEIECLDEEFVHDIARIMSKYCLPSWEITRIMDNFECEIAVAKESYDNERSLVQFREMERKDLGKRLNSFLVGA